MSTRRLVPMRHWSVTRTGSVVRPAPARRVARGESDLLDSGMVRSGNRDKTKKAPGVSGGLGNAVCETSVEGARRQGLRWEAKPIPVKAGGAVHGRHGTRNIGGTHGERKRG